MLLKVLTETVESDPTFLDKLNDNVGGTIFWCSVGLAAVAVLIAYFAKKRRR